MYIIIDVHPEKNLRNPWNHIRTVVRSKAKAQRVAAELGLRYEYVSDEVYEQAWWNRYMRRGNSPERPLYL